MKKAALYVRVSTKEQKKGLSIGSQIDALTTFCHENGLIVYGIYNDAGISGGKRWDKRPAMSRMISDCKNGSVDIVLFTRLDRFYRSCENYYLTINEMSGVPWKAIWEDYDTETPDGITKMTLMLAISQDELLRDSARIKRSMAFKRERGDNLGPVPVGYVKSEDRRKFVVDESMRTVIEDAFRIYLDTSSTTKVKDHLSTHGVNYSITAVRNLLRNRTYCGDHCGTPCPPIISEETHGRVIERMGYRHRDPVCNTYLFSGIPICGTCGLRMTASSFKQNGKVYREYRCSGGRFGKVHNGKRKFQIAERKLESQLIDHLDELIRDYNISARSIESEDHSKIESEIRSKKARLERLKVLFEEGDIDLDSYRSKRDLLQAEIHQTESRLEPTKEITLPSNWRDIYDSLDDDHKKAFWINTIRKIKINPDRVIRASDIEFIN